MAATIFVPGLIAVSVKKPLAQIFDFLGYCRDGVTIREQIRVRPIHGDEGGGPEGVPVDYCYLGEFHEVRLELYKYDGDVLAQVCNRLSSTTEKARGEVWEPGWLIRGGGEQFQLKLETQLRFAQGPPSFSRIYNVAIPLSPIEYPLGPKEMLVLMEWTCVPDSNGVLFTVPGT